MRQIPSFKGVNQEVNIGTHSRFLVAIVLVALAVGAIGGPSISSAFSDLFFGRPRVVHVFNDDAEIATSGVVVAASLSYSFPTTHRLVIAFSAVGAINGFNVSALEYLGCDVDGVACVGHQNDPAIIPLGWVNVLSNNFPGSAAWDNTVGYTWLAPSPLGTSLPPGAHTVTIQVAVGNALAGCGGGSPGCGGPGTAFIEARNLIVTIVSGGTD